MSALARIDRVLPPITWVVAALVVVLLFVGPSLVGADKETPPATAAPAGKAAAPSGKAVFASAGCGGCHTFKPAGATGSIGADPPRVDLDAGGGPGGGGGGPGGPPPLRPPPSAAANPAPAPRRGP